MEVPMLGDHRYDLRHHKRWGLLNLPFIELYMLVPFFLPMDPLFSYTNPLVEPMVLMQVSNGTDESRNIIVYPMEPPHILGSFRR